MSELTIEQGAFSELVRLDEEDFFDGTQYAVYQRLQREAPAYWYGARNAWILTRQADIRLVGTNPGRFSSAHGIFLQDIRPGVAKAPAEALFGVGEQITIADPPRHTDLRRAVAPAFTPRALAARQIAIKELCGSLLADIDRNAAFDFVSQLAGRLPTMISIQLLGLPVSDELILRSWADILEGFVGIEPTEQQFRESVQAFSEFRDYLHDIFVHKRIHPADDVISVMATQMSARGAVTEQNVISVAMTLVAGGNHTMRAALAGIAALFAAHPEQYRTLQEEPSGARGAVEEVLRLVSPVRGHVRRVMQASELPCGQKVAVGEYLYLAYDAANRESEIFSDPNTFHYDRSESAKHISFGFGPHVCIAAPLVRMAATAFLECLLDNTAAIELAGPEVRSSALHRSGWTSLPVTLRELT